MTGSYLVTPKHNSVRTLALALALVSPLMIFAFSLYLPPAGDFLDAFWPAAHIPLHPYQVGPYLNPPWVALLFYPLTFFTERIAQAVIAYLNLSITLLLVARYGGNRWSFLLVITSAPFLSLLVNGNIDWLPMLAFLLPANWGLAVTFSKPQVGVFAGLVWFKQAKQKILFLLPAAGLLLLSLLVWGWWFLDMYHQVFQSGRRTVGPWNISPFPWLVPLGVLLLFYAWKREDELLAVTATLCMAPYFAVYSFTTFFAMLAARAPWVASIAWIVLWIFFISLRWMMTQY